MGKGIAIVEHHVSTDPVYCTFDGPDDSFGMRSVCRYQVIRDKHGPGGRVDRGLFRCILFNEWLERNGVDCLRCQACKRACGEEP